MHTHDHEHHHHHETTTDLRVAFFLNLTFTVLEIAGGLWTNSTAILADALHDLGDSFSLGLAWFLDNYAQKEHDIRFSYGYRRFSLLGALLNALILLGGSLLILTEVVPRLLNPEETNVPGMILFAIGGVLVNGLAVLRVRRGDSLNARVVSWHLLEDVLGWLAVLLVSIIMLFVNLPILDPLLSILITCFVLFNVLKYLRQTAAVFLQAVPEGINLHQLEHQLADIEHVQSVHHTHLWSLDGQNHVLTTHLVVPTDATLELIGCVKRQVKGLTGALPLAHVTVEIECQAGDCSMAAEGC